VALLRVAAEQAVTESLPAAEQAVAEGALAVALLRVAVVLLVAA